MFFSNSIADYYMNTIGDMQNEKDFFYRCNEFEYNHDFVIFLWKIDDDLLVFGVLSSNVYLYEIEYFKFLFQKLISLNIYKNFYSL